MNKIEMGKEYKTRDGEDVRVLCTDGPDEEYPVIAVIGKKTNVCCYDPYGSFYRNECSSGLDLIEVKSRFKHEVWINVYPTLSILGVYGSREAADRHADSGRIACVKIVVEGEEGEGL